MQGPLSQTGEAGNGLLAEPLALPGGLAVPNRIAKAAMTENLADGHGRVTRELVALYERWGRSGAGLLITGNVMVDPRYLEAPANLVIPPPEDRFYGGQPAGQGMAERVAGLAALAAAARAGGARVIMQLSHAGRQTPGIVSRRPVAPSAVALDMPGRAIYPFHPPRAMTGEEVEDAIARFGHAARIAREAGFDGVQVHGAHGYLVSQFLSPNANRRTDAWGGHADKRMAFLLAVIGAVRREAGEEFPVALKLNSADFQKGGFAEQDALGVIDRLSPLGLAFIEVSGGTYEDPQMFGAAASTRAREAYFAQFAAMVSARTATPVMLTGGFRSRAGMEGALAERVCALVGMARPFCVAPDRAGELAAGRAERMEEAPARAQPGGGGGRLARMLALFASQAWYYEQILRLGRGRDARPGMSLPGAMVRFRLRLSAAIRARKRAMAGR